MTEKLQPSTKQKLAAIVNGFDDFDSEMKSGTRVCHVKISAYESDKLTVHSNPI